jgi:hypothetical protein
VLLVETQFLTLLVRLHILLADSHLYAIDRLAIPIQFVLSSSGSQIAVNAAARECEMANGS